MLPSFGGVLFSHDVIFVGSMLLVAGGNHLYRGFGLYSFPTAILFMVVAVTAIPLAILHGILSTWARRLRDYVMHS